MPALSRRRLLTIAPLAALPVAARAATPAPDRRALVLTVRAMADLDSCGDPALLAFRDAEMERVSKSLPEAPDLLRLHRLYPASRRAVDLRPPTPVIDLAALHDACDAARPVAFRYTDLSDRVTERQVLPLELVHPGHGVLLFAWCELRDAPRRFFVHAMEGLSLGSGSFADRRAELIRLTADHYCP